MDVTTLTCSSHNFSLIPIRDEYYYYYYLIYLNNSYLGFDEHKKIYILIILIHI